MNLSAKIFAALVAGVVLGVLAKLPSLSLLADVFDVLQPLGTIFIRLITMVVVPLVIASLFTGIASLGDIRRLGRVGGRTLVWFLLTTTIAAAIGVGIAVASGVGRGTTSSLPVPPMAARLIVEPGSQPTPAPAVPGVVDTLIGLTPQNPIAAAASGDLLPLIVAVCIFGAAATMVAAEKRQPVVAFFEGVNDLCMVVIGWVMKLAPAAVLILVGALVAKSGADLLRNLTYFMVIVVVVLLVHVTLVLAPALRVGAGLGVGKMVRTTSDALLLAFSTASSSATLPVSMAAARRLGLPQDVVGFVLPAGSTLNKNGAAAYKAVTAVFIAHVLGMHLGAGELVTIWLTSTMAAFAGAGVPGSSLVTTMIVLNAIGIGANAAAGMALVAGVDRPLDMCRTTVNTFGNLVGAAVVAKRSA